MEKKHKNRFSIVFNEVDSRQFFAMEKLNSLPPRKIAVYIAEAVSSYEKKSKTAGLTADSGKRKRGRPRKTETLSPDGELADKSDLHALSDISSTQLQHGIARDNEMQDKQILVDGDMLDSMMAIIEN